jgi:hypothetical protein
MPSLARSPQAPQIGYNFYVGGVPIFTNLRGYVEFDTKNRLGGGPRSLL